MNGGLYSYKVYHLLRDCNKNQKIRSIYVNCFKTLRFLSEVNIKLQKMHFLDYNSGRKRKH